ncbi:hypothetical protein XB02_15515 [Pantoea ananatis]|nr:hypothetical protein XB02_15515 [Pantoea ananatis]
MFRSEEEKVNIVIGEALLTLLEDDADISSEALRVQLNRMLETETDDARRQLIDHALRQTRRLLSGAASEDSNFFGERHLHLWAGNGH